MSSVDKPEWTGKRVYLRAISLEDAEALYQCWSHPEVSCWLGAPPLHSISDTREVISHLLHLANEEESLRFSIIVPDGKVIGSGGFNYWQLEGAYRGEVGCELLPEYWGQGYMKEALELILGYGFKSLGLNRIEAICRPDNTRAARLFTGLGFKQEGILRQYRHTVLGYQDVAMYSLLHSDRVEKRQM